MLHLAHRALMPMYSHATDRPWAQTRETPDDVPNHFMAYGSFIQRFGDRRRLNWFIWLNVHNFPKQDHSYNISMAVIGKIPIIVFEQYYQFHNFLALFAEEKSVKSCLYVYLKTGRYRTYTATKQNCMFKSLIAVSYLSQHFNKFQFFSRDPNILWFIIFPFSCPIVL